ncbi:MAG: GNAT family N-acetyltransferase [Acidobacteriota bacterium]
MAGLDFHLSRRLAAEERDEIQRFLDRVDDSTLEQDPEMPRILRDPRRPCFFTARREGRIVCYAQILERPQGPFARAELPFGPVFSDPEALLPSLEAIHRSYSLAGFASLSIGLGVRDTAWTREIEAALERRIRIRRQDDDRNWSSLAVDLRREPRELLRRMSKGHRSAIKRALRDGLTVRRDLSPAAMETFSRLFLKMHAARGHQVEAEQTRAILHDTLAFLDRRKKGHLFLAADSGGAILGGAIVVHQGTVARYYKGAADPDRRNQPVLHPVLFEAMTTARREGFRAFDLWGYNHRVGKEDQRYQINRFKKGFGGEFISYPRIMYCFLGWRGAALRTLKKARGWL